MKIQQIKPVHEILKYKKRDKNMNSWYEMRVGGERVAAFEPINPNSLEKVMQLLDDTRLTLYGDKMLQVVAVSSEGWEEVVHEEHPTVFED